MVEVTVESGLFSSTKVNVEDSGGPGRPVVLIHGWPLSGASWKAQIPALTAAGYRVISYDRRGFGRSDKPSGGYDYDTLADDLRALLERLDLRDVTLVGFSMGGGEVARYVSRHGEDRVRSVVFAAAVPPYLAQTDDNPDGPLTEDKAEEMTDQLTDDRDGFFDQFITDFFSTDGVLQVSEAQRQEAIALCRQSDEKAALKCMESFGTTDFRFFSTDGVLQVSEAQRQEAIALCRQSDEKAALKCMESFGTTDFRDDLPAITVPTLVLHGSGDAVVPFEGSGRLTHRAVAHSELVVLTGAPHGCNVTHADLFNTAVLDFLGRA